MIKFIDNRNKFFTLSVSLILLVAVFTFINGVKLDIQFQGGYIVTYSYDGNVDKDKVKDTIEKSIHENVSVQNTKDIRTGTNRIIVSLGDNKSLNVDTQSVLKKTLQTSFAKNNFKEVQVNNVDPTTGKEFFAKCMVAVAVAALLIVIYIAIRFKKIGGWSAGIMAVISLFHDIVMVYGTFIVLKIPLNDSFIAACLTILGYSINDTIVIYDRIRENKKIYGSKMPIGELVNKSINQSFVRSINITVATVLAMTVVLVVAKIYNVDTIVSFVLPLIVGMITGVYSTICIAGPLWVVWQEHQRKKRIEQRNSQS